MNNGSRYFLQNALKALTTTIAVGNKLYFKN